MNIQEVIDFICQTPENTNPNVLKGMLEELSGGTPTGSLPITVNGTYDVTNYASVVVNVTDYPSGVKYSQFSIYQYDGASGEDEEVFHCIIPYQQGFTWNQLINSSYCPLDSTGSFKEFTIDDGKVYSIYSESTWGVKSSGDQVLATDLLSEYNAYRSDVEW